MLVVLSGVQRYAPPTPGTYPARTTHRPVCLASFWTSKAVIHPSHNLNSYRVPDLLTATLGAVMLQTVRITVQTNLRRLRKTVHASNAESNMTIIERPAPVTRNHKDVGLCVCLSV